MLSRNQKHFSVLAALLVGACLWSNVNAQLTYSAFNEASMANLALSDLGVDFAAANPATLSRFFLQKRFLFAGEITNGYRLDYYKNQPIDFFVAFPIYKSLTFGFARSEREGDSFTPARGGLSVYGFQHPLRSIHFHYRQTWSVGLGMKIKNNYRIGASLRHQEFVARPIYLTGLLLGQSFQSLDLGFQGERGRISWGVVLRNLMNFRTTEALDKFTVRIIDDTGNEILWNPTQYSGVAFEPERALEAGISWQISRKWQFLGDVTSRKELAYGVRWNVFSKFYLTGGNGGKFDRIYNDEVLEYATLGAQFKTDLFNIGVTWIIPSRQGRTQMIQTPYGNYFINQNTEHRLLLGFAITR